MQWENKPINEIERSFIEGYERLVRSGKSYDEGHLNAAPDIAKDVMIFVHDPGLKKESILSHLGIKNSVLFEDSAEYWDVKSEHGTLLSNEYSLIHATIGFDGMDYRPVLGSRKGRRRNCFQAWWEGVILSRDDFGNRETINRSELISYIRNEEGGAHVSSRYKRDTPTDKLVRLMQGEYLDGYMILDEGSEITAYPHAPAYATVRQIGWELEETLRHNRPDLIRLANLNPTIGPRMRPAPPEML